MSGDPTRLRLAVTGAPGTGKTTLSTALATALGLPSTDAPPADVVDVPNGLPRSIHTMLSGFERRLDEEARLKGFVSDGSLLHECALERAAIDSDPDRRLARRRPVSWLKTAPDRAFLRRYVEALEGIVARSARESYDAVVHLRIDAATANAHRLAIDRALLELIDRSGLPYAVCAGPCEDIVRSVAGAYGPALRVPSTDVVEEGRHAGA
jgi:hypothetical protein